MSRGCLLLCLFWDGTKPCGFCYGGVLVLGVCRDVGHVKTECNHWKTQSTSHEQQSNRATEQRQSSDPASQITAAPEHHHSPQITTTPSPKRSQTQGRHRSPEAHPPKPPHCIPPCTRPRSEITQPLTARMPRSGVGDLRDTHPACIASVRVRTRTSNPNPLRRTHQCVGMSHAADAELSCVSIPATPGLPLPPSSLRPAYVLCFTLTGEVGRQVAKRPPLQPWEPSHLGDRGHPCSPGNNTRLPRLFVRPSFCSSGRVSQGHACAYCACAIRHGCVYLRTNEKQNSA